MPFKKGQSGNSNGRPKGALSKKTVQWQEAGKDLITGGIERAQQIMQDADDDKYMDYFFKLLEYYKPKLQRADLRHDHGKVVIEVVRRDNDNTDSPTAITPITAASQD